jgi:hypothetical protein
MEIKYLKIKENMMMIMIVMVNIIVIFRINIFFFNAIILFFYYNLGIYKARRKGGKTSKKSSKNSKVTSISNKKRSQSIGSVDSQDDEANDNNITIDNSFIQVFRSSSPPTLTSDYLEKGRSMINKGKNNSQAAQR